MNEDCPKSTRIDWKSVIDRIKEELPSFQERDITPTLRTLQSGF
jgi:hypothetical protein